VKLWGRGGKVDEIALIVSLQDENVVTALTSHLDDAIEVRSVSPSESIIAETTVILDADDVSVGLIQAENTLLALLDDSHSLRTESNQILNLLISYNGFS